MTRTAPTGIVLIGRYKETRSFENKDESGRVTSMTKAYIVHVPHADGTINRELIYFPRDPDYRGAALDIDTMHAFPVQVRVKRNGRDLSYTARSDLMPFTAPEVA